MNWKEMLSYFSLTTLPFGKEISTESLQLLPSVEKNLAAARLLVDTHGIGAIVGKSGTGKSCLLRLLASRLPAGLFKPLYLCHTSVGILEFYTHLCTLFGLSASCRRAAMFRDLQEHILSMNGSRHLHPVLLIDEAHLLSNEILAEIRLLTNFRIDSLNALTVMLCGAETLSLRFGLTMLEALANSITVTIPVEGLAPEESTSFVEARLNACGAHAPLFTKNALTLIHQASGGILRTIGTIANAALFKAFLAKSTQVEAEHVQSVVQR
jgi:type II secretory pathway predicted ATPase ExeA